MDDLAIRLLRKTMIPTCPHTASPCLDRLTIQSCRFGRWTFLSQLDIHPTGPITSNGMRLPRDGLLFVMEEVPRCLCSQVYHTCSQRRHTANARHVGVLNRGVTCEHPSNGARPRSSEVGTRCNRSAGCGNADMPNSTNFVTQRRIFRPFMSM